MKSFSESNFVNFREAFPWISRRTFITNHKKTFKLSLFLHFLIRFKLFNKNKNSVRPFTCKVCVNNRIKRQNYSEYDFWHRKRRLSFQQLILIAFLLLLPFKSLSFFPPLMKNVAAKNKQHHQIMQTFNKHQ